MTETAQMRTWAEISLDRLAHNYQTLRAMLAPDCRFLGLCKANAYGHGALQVGRKLEALGADMLAVACVDEAAELRRGGVTIPILCLGQTPPQLAELLLEHDVTQTVSDLETGRALARAAQAAGRTLKIHVKVDTGMTRLGFLWRGGGERETAAAIAALCALPGLEAEGLFTHFADADGNEEYTMGQFTRFLDARQALEALGVRFKICHCAASAAVLNYPCTHMDMVRPGIALYGSKNIYVRKRAKGTERSDLADPGGGGEDVLRRRTGDAHVLRANQHGPGYHALHRRLVQDRGQAHGPVRSRLSELSLHDELLRPEPAAVRQARPGNAHRGHR